MNTESIVIIGAGPAGLTAALTLAKNGMAPIVFEKSNAVGGLARTTIYKGFRFDIGGHRFFTNIDAVQNLWHLILGDKLNKTSRLSRIYYQNRFFHYPLSLGDVFTTLGPVESFLILASYLEARMRPPGEEKTFEQWVSNRFGARLYRTFFKEYTEKVWGISCDQIHAEWTRQRIKGLSLYSAVLNALLGFQKSKSLIGEFYYPPEGPGMMWDGMQTVLADYGGSIVLNADVSLLHHEHGRIEYVSCCQDDRSMTHVPVSHLISSMSLKHLVARLEPKAPGVVLWAAEKLAYRALVMVGLIIDKKHLFPDQWLYIQDSAFRVGRIQNFKNWSSSMVPDPEKTGIGMEYFCSSGDMLWSMSDADLMRLAVEELSRLGLSRPEEVMDGFVLRQQDAYPVYHCDYNDHVATIRTYLATIENLQTIGRNGMHRYNNMDHSMYTGMLSAGNVLGEKNDLWGVEETIPDTSMKVLPGKAEIVFSQIFARMDKSAFGISLGAVLGLFLFVLTLWSSVLRIDLQAASFNLQLLGQYFFGYEVTVKGAFIALVFGFLWGFMFGWLFAFFRNLFLALYVYLTKEKIALLSFKAFFDQL